jgi:hypothetical protein
MLPLFSRFLSIKLESRHPLIGREKAQLALAVIEPPASCAGVDLF